MDAVHTFPLAKMDGGIRALTYMLFVLPPACVALAILSGQTSLYLTALFIVLMFLVTWIWSRPTSFMVTPHALRIIWPSRRREYARVDIVGAARITPGELRQEFGMLLRVGVGGLWGGFGLLWSFRGKHVAMYISRSRDMVLVRFREHMPLLVTPESPDEFVRMLTSPPART